MQYELGIYDYDLCSYDLQRSIFQAIEHKISTISVCTAFTGVCNEYISGTNIKLAVAIDYPYGQSSYESRQSSIISACKRKINIIELCVPYYYYHDSKWQELKKDLKSSAEICASNNIELRVISEYRFYSTDDFLTLCDFLKKCNINTIISSGGILLDDTNDNLTISKQIANNKIIDIIPSSNCWHKSHIKLLEKTNLNIIRFLNIEQFKRCIIK